MPVGAAIGGAAIIGGVATSKAASKTAKAATQNATANNATQLQVYNQNRQAQQPFLQGGNTAWQAWQSMMGLSPQSAPAGGQPQQQGTNMGQPVLTSGRVGTGANLAARFAANGMEDRFSAPMPNALAPRPGQVTPQPVGQPVAMPAPNQPAQPGAPAGTPNALGGFDAFKASMGYQAGLDEGNRGIGQRLANMGRLQSGDAVREAARFNQTYANSFAGDYLARLMQGTQVGTGAANALAGVGSNYANATSANNNAALNARANANAATGQAWSDGAANVATGAAYLYGNRSTNGNALASSYSGSAPPTFW